MKNEGMVISVDNYKDFVRQSSMVIKSMKDNETAAIMYADVTGFQLVNDFYGFAEGDRFLYALSNLLKTLPNTRVCGRVFSDHYLRLAVMDKGLDIQQCAADYERRLEQFLEEQYLYHMNCRLKVCCGYCLVENGVQGLVKAVDDANLARKESKGTSHSSINWFDNAMRRKVKERKDMEVAIQSALREEAFIFYLQPKVNLHTGQVVGAEALARWIKADGSMVYPDSFIPLMESNGTIMELDFLIYKKVCQYLQTRIEQGLHCVPISVNISRTHIYQRNFAQNLHKIAQEYGVAPHYLEFELTENILMEEFDYAKGVMDELRGYGYKVSIDDFGSGFTGVNIWQKLDFDVLKLDKTFISKNAEERKRNDTIITSITYVGKKRHTELLCEGTETKEQCRHMKELGCEVAQGYYFSKPVSIEKFENILEDNNGYYSVFWAESAEKLEEIQSVEEWKRLQLDNFYREIYDMVDCAIIQYREDNKNKNKFRCISLNRYAVELYGFSDKNEAVQEEIDIVNDFIMEEDLLTNIDKIQSMTHTGDAVVLDFRIRRMDGKIRYVTGTLKIMLDQNGHKIYLGVLVDKSKRQEMELLKERLNMVAENTPGDVVILTFSKDTCQTQYLTNGLCRVLGYSKKEFEEIWTKTNGQNLLYAEDRAMLMEEVPRLAREMKPINLNFRTIHKDGNLGWNNFSADYAYEKKEGCAVYHGIITDITEIKKKEEALAESEKHYHAAAVILKADIWNYNFKKGIMELPASEELSDLDLGGKTKISLKEFLESGHIHPDYIETYLGIYRAIARGESNSRVELMAMTKTEGYQWFQIQCQVIEYEDGKPVEMVGVAKNIHEEKQRQERFQEMKEKAMLDKLTGFCNRETATDLIQERLDRLADEDVAALFLFDLDNFKMINDNFGHIEGDNVLRTICKGVAGKVPHDSILGRLGGDEFILFISDLGGRENAGEIADIICQSVNGSLWVEKQAVTLSASVGIAIAKRSMQFEELYRRADTAMYQVKGRSKNGYHVWDGDEKM